MVERRPRKSANQPARSIKLGSGSLSPCRLVFVPQSRWYSFCEKEKDLLADKSEIWRNMAKFRGELAYEPRRRLAGPTTTGSLPVPSVSLRAAELPNNMCNHYALFNARALLIFHNFQTECGNQANFYSNLFVIGRIEDRRC